MEFEEAFRITEDAVKKINKHVSGKVQIAILRGAWDEKTYEEIARAENYTPRYLQQDAGPKLWKLLSEAFGAIVNKNNFRTFMEFTSQLSSPAIDSSGSSIDHPLEDGDNFWNSTLRRPDLTDAPDVSRFLGRSRTCQNFKELITSGYRLLCIYGVGGVGKTALAVKLAQELRDQFEGVIYRSIDPSIDISQFEVGVIRYLSDQSEPQPGWSNLLSYLCNYRCLVILDGWESLLRCNVHDGSYLPDSETYRDLLLRFGRANAMVQSCFIITSREKPREVEILEAETAHTYSYQLYGLGELSGQTFLSMKNLTVDDDSHWREVLNRYEGNPLLLNMAVPLIGVFGGNITNFLQQFLVTSSFLDEMVELLDQQLERLSDLENFVIDYLTECEEYAKFTDILLNVVRQHSVNELAEVLQSLLRRSLISHHQSSYLLHPLFRRYLVQKRRQ